MGLRVPRGRRSAQSPTPLCLHGVRGANCAQVLRSLLQLPNASSERGGSQEIELKAELACCSFSGDEGHSSSPEGLCSFPAML